MLIEFLKCFLNVMKEILTHPWSPSVQEGSIKQKTVTVIPNKRLQSDFKSLIS